MRIKLRGRPRVAPNAAGFVLWAILLSPTVPFAEAADDVPPAVARILEDNAAELLARLTNPTGDPGQGLVETDDVYSGTAAIKIIPMQRFEPRIPGWGYKISE